MKKLLALILALTMALCLVSCGDEPKTEEPKSPAIEDEKPVSAPAELPEPTPLLTSEDTAKKFFDAMASLDMDTLFDLCVDPASIEGLISSGKFADEEAIRAAFAEELSEDLSGMVLALGDNCSLTRFDVLGFTEIPTEGVYNYYQNICFEEGTEIPDVLIETAAYVTAAITIQGDADQLNTESGNVPLIRIDGKWYVATHLNTGASEQATPAE